MRTKRCKTGFTLVELLVVVIIIAVLAAVALPQYQKAVVHAESVRALALLKELMQAQEHYYLEHGEYAGHFADLDVNIPFTETRRAWSPGDPSEARSQGNWSFTIEKGSRFVSISAGILTGPYQSAGFVYQIKHSDSKIPLGLSCVERTSNSRAKGRYCQQIMKGTWLYQHGGAWDYFALP